MIHCVTTDPQYAASDKEKLTPMGATGLSAPIQSMYQSTELWFLLPPPLMDPDCDHHPMNIKIALSLVAESTSGNNFLINFLSLCLFFLPTSSQNIL